MRLTRGKVYYDFVPEIEPRISISSGDRLIVETFDAAGGMFLDGWVYERPNPATGPIYIKDAMPGDTLEIEIHDIKLIGKGYMHIINHKEPTEFSKNGHEFITSEATSDNNIKILNNGNKHFPANPMIGVIGVAVPPNQKGVFFGSDVGDYGGNMDNTAIKAGVKVYLPIYVEGALLGIGDIHGAMGDGEIFDQGIEMCADVDITVKVRKDMEIHRPLVISDHIISTTASADTMEEACNHVASDMRRILEEYYNLSHVDAGLAIGLYGNIKVCQIINKTMRMEISIDILKKYFNAME